jgi:hypothetical protein
MCNKSKKKCETYWEKFREPVSVLRERKKKTPAGTNLSDRSITQLVTTTIDEDNIEQENATNTHYM